MIWQIVKHNKLGFFYFLKARVPLLFLDRLCWNWRLFWMFPNKINKYLNMNSSNFTYQERSIRPDNPPTQAIASDMNYLPPQSGANYVAQQAVYHSDMPPQYRNTQPTQYPQPTTSYYPSQGSNYVETTGAVRPDLLVQSPPVRPTLESRYIQPRVNNF